jgi:type IV pilus assembly protein PilC
VPIFTYKAKKFTGEETSGREEAKDKRDLANTLKQQGFVLVTATEESGSAKTFSFSMPKIFGIASLEEKMIFARNLGVMIGAGLALAKALEILQKQTTNKRFRAVIESVNKDITRGKTFSESLANNPKVFSPLFVAMVAAGETSGKLQEALTIVSNQMKDDYELRKRVKGALIYPAVIIVAMIVIGILMLIYVVPTLTKTFIELNIQLPITTRFLIAASNFLVNNIILIIIVFPFILYGIYMVLKLPAVKSLWDRLIMHLPVLGKLNREMNAARTVRTLGSLIASGVPILKALEITSDILQNHIYKDVLTQAKESVQKGKTVSSSFIAHADVYPILVGEMMAVGEETGQTSEMLTKLAEFYENEVSEATKNLSSIIEPVLMLVIGVVVGFFAISMIQPLYSSLGNTKL